MKKLSKKQKLIGFIAIILVVVILAIAITTNIANRKIGNEGYLSTTANANSNLVAGYIKKGITIGGITGTLESLNTFDATAEPEDILWGKTGYVKGEKITGTRVNTVTLGKESQKVFEENTILTDDYGNSVKIPEGFKIAEDSATTVTGGVVVEDVSAGDNNTKGSQFVWVPIGDVITDENNSKTTITLGRYTFVTQIQASELCQNMYQTTDFESDLVNSYAWDTALKFIQTFSLNKNYANKEIPQNDIIKCGEIFSGEEEDIECNIFDMAKTPGELITETFMESETHVTVRGSVFMNAYHRPIGRDTLLDINTSYNYISFRPILYL